jgi:TRAP-type C4-dicarboxylate transport system substrate-binding protein
MTTTVRKALVAAAALVACAAQATEFRSADTHNADDYPTVVAVKKMSELLEAKSGGKHKIKVFNKQALGSEKETIDQVKIGALDLTCRRCRSCSTRSRTCARCSTARWATRS